MSSEYAVLIHGDEDAWSEASAEQQAEVYGRHSEFARLLAEGGHTITGGAELAHPGTARLVRADGVTDGPYAEGAEQLGGYYSVRTDDLDGLLAICAVLASGGDTVEVRPTIDHS